MKKNYPFSCAIEIKATDTNSIPASALKPHQLKALQAVRTAGGLTYKIPDASHLRLPFDAFQLKNTQSFVIACFLKHNICLAIEPDHWAGATPTSPSTFKIQI